MAGTLQVENLIGPTSGANANKIIIPSGQMLDASAGFVAPAGSVIQYVHGEYNIPQASQMHTISSQALVASGLVLQITPKYATSLLVAEFDANWDDQTTNPDGLLTAIYRDGVNLQAAGGYGAGTFQYNNPAQDNYSLVSNRAEAIAGSTSLTEFRLYIRSWNGIAIRFAAHAGIARARIWEIAQ